MARAGHRVNVREARRNFRQVLAWVEAGEEVVLTRREVEVGRIVAPARGTTPLPSMESFRGRIQVRGRAMSDEVIARRRGERA